MVQTSETIPAKSKGRSPLRAIKIWPYVFCLPFMLAYCLFQLFPTLYSLFLSFFDWNGIGPKTFVGFENYVKLLTTDKMFFKSLGNTVILMVMSTPITVFLGMVVAFWLFNVKKGRRLYQTINFFPYITTPVAIGFIFSYLFEWQSGYINQLLMGFGIMKEPYFWLQSKWAIRFIIVIMVIWRYLGYYMSIYLAAMTAVSTDIYEAARVDGANSITIFFRITIPLLKNTTTFLIITSMIGGLQMFEEPLLLLSGWANIGNGATGGPDNAVLTTIWKFYNEAFRLDNRLGYSSAIAYSLFVFILLFSLAGNWISKRGEGKNA